MVYSLFAHRFQDFLDNSINLPQPLNDLPLIIGDWTGMDLTIPTVTLEYMERNFADDFLSRRYINQKNDQWFDLYVVFCSSQPAGILGHQPLVCYPNNGWIHDETKPTQIILSNNRSISCLIHRFHKPEPLQSEIFVLNFYILNGDITTNESGFSSIWGRRPNIAGNPARYVAQIQISSNIRNNVLEAAQDLIESILVFFPTTTK